MSDTAYRRPLRRSLARRVRPGAVVLLGAMTLAAGGAAAQSGGATTKRTASSSSKATTVQAVQAKLGVAADGAFGPKSKRALKRWQRAHGLAADGVIGPATLAAMGIKAPRATAAMPKSRTAVSPALQRIAQCESGGNPAAVSAGGEYRGKYQFSRATWRRLGGKGDPAAAPEAEQDRLAAKLYAAQGSAPWPSCG